MIGCDAIALPFSLEQPRQAPILKDLTVSLTGRTVGHYVALIKDGFEGSSAPVALLALMAMDPSWLRKLVWER